MPQVKDGPEELNKLLEEVYNQCMEYQRGHEKKDQSECARIAWNAAKKAGWKKTRGKWVKE